MGQRSSFAAVKGAKVLLKWEECALGMEQKLNTTVAVLKDAQIIS